MLNEMKSSKKSMIILNGSVSYAPQKPWIMSDTLRNNVTFTLPYEKERFERAVHYAALEKDI